MCSWFGCDLSRYLITFSQLDVSGIHAMPPPSFTIPISGTWAVLDEVGDSLGETGAFSWTGLSFALCLDALYTRTNCHGLALDLSFTYQYYQLHISFISDLIAVAPINQVLALVRCR